MFNTVPWYRDIFWDNYHTVKISYRYNSNCNTVQQPTFTSVVRRAQSSHDDGWDVISELLRPWEIITAHTNTHTLHRQRIRNVLIIPYHSNIHTTVWDPARYAFTIHTDHIRADAVQSTNHITPLRTRANHRDAKSNYCDSSMLPPCLWKRSA